jgi:hypothetical protein
LPSALPSSSLPRPSCSGRFPASGNLQRSRSRPLPDRPLPELRSVEFLRRCVSYQPSVLEHTLPRNAEGGLQSHSPVAPGRECLDPPTQRQGEIRPQTRATDREKEGRQPRSDRLGPCLSPIGFRNIETGNTLSPSRSRAAELQDQAGGVSPPASRLCVQDFALGPVAGTIFVRFGPK